MKSRLHWLNRERLKIYPRIFLALFLVFGSVFVAKNIFELKGNPLGIEFIAFWGASHLALTGHAQDAYNSSLLLKAQQVAVPVSESVYEWYYPPTFYLVILPLALLSYPAAYWAFMLSTLGGYVLVLRRIVRGSTAMWCLAAFPGLWINLFRGQNGFLTAALAGAAILSVERRPFLAGVFIGLLAVKPHLAMLFPVALLAIGAWRTLITAVVTAIAFMGMSTAILGTAVLKGFLENLGYARLFMEKGALLWTFSPSLFAFMRLLGMPVAWAYAAHVVVSAVAVIVVWRVWRDCRNRNLRGAALMTATLLISPYIFGYDLTWLAFPIAWLALDGLSNGWQRGEREVLVVAWLMPLLMNPIAEALKLQIGPLVLCSLLWVTFRRATVASMIDATVDEGHTGQFGTFP